MDELTFYQWVRCPRHPDIGHLHRRAAKLEVQCEACGRRYSIADGVLDLLDEEANADTFLHAEAEQWDSQAAGHDRARQMDAIYLASMEAAVHALKVRPGDLILDAACGTGMTLRSYARPGLRVVALDLSRQSLQQVQESVNGCRVFRVRGDLQALPLASATFSLVLCANALQHVRTAEARRKVVEELARVSQPGGRVVVSVHNFSIPKQQKGWPKEGKANSPSGAIQYIYRFDAEEFRDLLASVLQVEQIRGAGLPLPYRLKLSPLSRRLERLLRRLPISTRWGHMLIGVGRVKPR